MAHNLRSNPKKNSRYYTEDSTNVNIPEDGTTTKSTNISPNMTEKTANKNTNETTEHQNEEEFYNLEDDNLDNHQIEGEEQPNRNNNITKTTTTPRETTPIVHTTTTPSTTTNPTDLNTLMDFLNNKFQNISQEIGHVNSKLSQEIEQNFKEQEKLITNTEKEITESLKGYIDERCDKITSDVNKRFSYYDQQIENRQQTLKTDLISQFETQLNQHNTKTDTKLEQLVNELPIQIKHQTEQTIIKNNEAMETIFEERHRIYETKLHSTQNQITEIRDITEQQNLNWKENTNQILNLQESINKMNYNPSTWKYNTENPTQQITPEIIVHYEGNGLSDPNSAMPKFNGKQKNPLIFLNQFDKYYDNYSKRKGHKNLLSYIELVEISLEAPSANWFQIIKNEIKNKEDFKIKFLNQYWSQPIQRAWRRKIESETYNEKSRLTRSEYLIDRSLILRSITPNFTETDIVNIMADNFNNRIRDSVKVQNVTTIQHFVDILNKEDIEDRTDKQPKNLADDRPNQQNHQPSNRRTNQNFETRNYNRNHNQNQSDQYDRYRNFIPRPNQNHNNRDRYQNFNNNHYIPPSRHNDNSYRHDRYNQHSQNNYNYSREYNPRERQPNPYQYEQTQRRQSPDRRRNGAEIRHLQITDPHNYGRSTNLPNRGRTAEQLYLIQNLRENRIEQSTAQRGRSNSLQHTQNLAPIRRNNSCEQVFNSQDFVTQSRTNVHNSTNQPSEN